MTSSLGLDIRGDQSTGMSFYMGPIKHALLKSFDKGVPAEQQLDLDRIVPLGGKIIRRANTGIICPCSTSLVAHQQLLTHHLLMTLSSSCCSSVDL
jgi:hypothetical protein